MANTKRMKKLVFLADIDIKRSPPVRAQLRDDVVNDYAENYKAKVPMPVVHLFQDKSDKWYLVADGLHRIHAHAKLGRKAIEAEVHEGGYDQALKYALLANVNHGLRRSNEDKRQSAATALSRFPTASNVQIAGMCCIDDKTVAVVRKELEVAGKVVETATRTGSDGKSRPSVVTRTTSEIRGSTSKKPKESEEILDDTGYLVPKQIVETWERRGEFVNVVKLIREADGYMKAIDGKDPLWAGVHIQEIRLLLDKAEATLKLNMPYAVCPLCQGHPNVQPGGVCRMCKGRGLIGKYMWSNVDEKTKSVREKACKK